MLRSPCYPRHRLVGHSNQEFGKPLVRNDADGALDAGPSGCFAEHGWSEDIWVENRRRHPGLCEACDELEQMLRNCERRVPGLTKGAVEAAPGLTLDPLP